HHRAIHLAAIALLLPALATGQTRASALLSRPPALLDSSEAFRVRIVMGIHVVRIRQALASVDSSTLGSELRAAQIPPDEITTTRGRGCQSIGWMLAQHQTGLITLGGLSLGVLHTTLGSITIAGSDSASTDLSLSNGQ